jgi:hypothetical protein
MTTKEIVRRLNSPGPISDAFLLSPAFIKVIIGPVGSGKTMTALRALVQVGKKQGGVYDARGVFRRKARVGVIRETYPNLEKNTLPSWFDLFPEELGKFTWKAPYTHRLTLIIAENAQGQATDVVDFEIEFRAIGDRSVEEVTRGWQVAAVLVDEADLQPPELLSFLTGRVGRGGLDRDAVVDPQIILSLNAPSIDNWVYALAIEKNLGDMDEDLREELGGRELIEVFLQPGGREPNAENLHNLPRGYYKIQAAANKHRPGYVARMIDNKFVPLQHGQPVNPQFDYGAHVRDIEWEPGRPLIVGVDQGLFAAAVASQRTSMGHLRTLREAVMFRQDGKTLDKIGPSAAGAMVRTMIAENFPELHPEMLRVVADPAAWAAADRADSEMDWIRAFSKALGQRVRKAKTNRQTLRNEAIWRAMAEREGYAVHPSCKHLIRGHLGGYHYRKAEIADGELRGHLEIADTIHTHVCDAEQYAALEGEHVIGDIRGRPRRRAPIRLESDFNVFTGV